MAATLSVKPVPRDGFTVSTLIFCFCAVLVAAAIIITGATNPNLELANPQVVTAGSLVAVFLLLGALIWHLRRNTRRLHLDLLETTRLALVAAKTDNAAFITNPEGNIQWVNESFVRLTGHSLEDALGKQPGALLLGPLQNINITQKIRDSFSHRRGLAIEMHCSNKRGHRFWLSLHLTPVTDPAGQVTQFIGIGSDITARRKAEEEVARVGRRSELLLNAAGDGILGFDLEGSISFMNAAAGRMTGFEPNELIGQPLSSIIRQLRVNRGDVQDEIVAGAAFIDGSVQVGDADEFRRKDGTSFSVEYTSTPVNEGESSLGSVMVFRDVTARVQSEVMRTRQLRQASLRADVAFALTSGDSLQIFLSRAMLCLVKHLDGAFARVWTFNAGDNMLELQASAGIYSHINGHHSRIPVGTLKVGKVALEGAPQVSENLLADPDILDKDWVARERMVAFIGFPLFLETRLVGVMAMYSRQRLPEDAMELFGCITESIAQGIVRKQAEESGVRQAALLDLSSDAIVLVGPDDRILSWNTAADLLYGWNGSAQAGQFGWEVLTPSRAIYERAKAFALQNGQWHDPFASILREGLPVPVDSRWFHCTTSGMAPGSLVIVQTDMTVRRQLEKQVLGGQRNETIAMLARGLAHQLTDALSPVLISTQTLRGRIADDSIRESLAILEGDTRRGLSLAHQVLSLGSEAEGSIQRLSSRTLLQNVAAIVQGTFPKCIQFRAEAEEDLWSVQANAVAIQQALLNFAFLTGTCLSEGGVLTLTTRNVYLQEGSPELPNNAETGCYVSFTFDHTGDSYPEGVQAILARESDGDTVFVPEEAGSPEAELNRAVHCGLRILHEHRGFVVPGHRPAHGPCLSIFIRAEEPAGGVSPDPAAVPAGNGELVLIVDDEESLLTATRDALESFGYRTIIARDGTEAVAAFSAQRGEVKAVLTDMIMPNMDGPSTIRVLRKLDPHIPIIASSGLLEPEKVRELTGFEDLAFLQKPYTADDLSQCIHDAVRRSA